MSRHPDGPTSMDSMQDAHDFYNHVPHLATQSNAYTDRDDPFAATSSIQDYPPIISSSRPHSSSASPKRAANRSISSPVPESKSVRDAAAAATQSSSLSSARLPQRSIKDLVHRFNQTSSDATDSHLPVPNSRDRYRRPSEGRTKLQKPRSPTNIRTASAPHGSAKVHSYGIASGLAAVAAPHMAMSGLAVAQPARKTSINHKPHKPLFGEVTNDVLTAQQPGHGIPDQSLRRGSEGTLNFAYPTRHHKRSRSDVYFHHPFVHLQNRKENHLSVDTSQINHKRSASDIIHGTEKAATYDVNSPLTPDSNSYESPLNAHQYSSPLSASTQQHVSPTSRLSSPDRPSRIPVSSSRRPGSIEPTSPAQRRIAAPVSPGHRRTTSKNHFPASPTQTRLPSSSASSLPTLTARRYDPFAQRQPSDGPSVKAFIKADPPQTSPQLRSSRPRQPVSAASTTASRAKAGARFESAVSKNDAPGPASNYRSKKKIPELGKVDFAERRARIQRAISANLPEDTSDQGSMSVRSSMSSVDRPHFNDDDALGYESATDRPKSKGDEVRLSEETPALNGLGLSLEVNGHAVDSFLGPSSATTSFDMSPTVPSNEPNGSSKDAAEVGNEEDTNGAATILSQVMRMRERSTSSGSRTDVETSPSLLPSPVPSGQDDQGSIQIMLDGSPAVHHGNDWPLEPSTARQEHFPPAPPTAKQEHFPRDDEITTESELDSFDSDAAEVGSSPYMAGDQSPVPVTPRPIKESLLRKAQHEVDHDITPRQPGKLGQHSVMTISSNWNRDSEAYDAVSRILEQYRISGHLTPEMLHEFEHHASSLSPDLSNLDGSDAGTIKVILDGLLADRHASLKQPPPESPYPATTLYSPADQGIMDSPEDNFKPGTAIIFSPPTKHSRETVIIETPQVNGFSPSSLAVNTPASQFDGPHDTTAGADQDDFRPMPPPKDEGYSPRSSVGNIYQGIDQVLPTHQQISSLPSSTRHSYSTEPLRLPEIPIGQGLGLAISVEPPSTTDSVPPPLPMYSPPPPPPPPSDKKKRSDDIAIDVPAKTPPTSLPANPTPAKSMAVEDRFRNFAAPARPSTDSRRPKLEPITLPQSQSNTSFQSSDRGVSLDESLASTQPPTPNPEIKRLLKRKHVIKELVDTEYSYHQDMKIIEDIYKGTVGDMITVDDKKVLFGNSDQVEGFSLDFYDALRRAVTGVYVPPKSSRWASKRESFSTSTSGERDSALVSDLPDEERDNTTRVGEVFVHYLTQMEKVYGGYLKNHDAANQRLAKLQGDATVKCWLAECHNNASDITAAWDLDSLLVKPVQRILKYPLLLHQLLESTSPNHPDHKALEYAVKEIMNVTHRINEAKKRSDLVEQMVTRKRKDSDVRTGLAKAFGRRTEKLKERVGIAEAYQDNVFDELAHKFGGHFIRLQVCMRDVQGSIAEVEKAVAHFLEFANALEAFIDVSPSTNPEIESKWRKFVLAIRELATVALPDHKAKVQIHVIKPMLTAIELHKGPQEAITKRKKRILDYAKCKAIEKGGSKPDKKTIEASEMYEALNEQLKLDLPRLYSLTADLIKACLDSNVVLQAQWMWLWKEKLAPVLEYVPRPEEPESHDLIYPENIVPSFGPDYDLVHSHVLGLAICNGSLLADAANFLSPQTTLHADESVPPSRATSRTRRPSNISSGRSGSRKLSQGSEHSPMLISPDLEKSFNIPLSPNMASFPNGQPGFYGRMRSSSSLSTSRGRTPTIPQAPTSTTLPSSRMPSLTSKSSFSASRPSTANNRPPDLQWGNSRPSLDPNGRKNSRPPSSASYQTAQQELGHGRFSGMFSSAMPMSDSPTHPTTPTSPKHAPDDTPVMFVAASLFEFNIDRARREAGYPYLTYVEGEVFDVVAQKGELWLAKNQDDNTNSLGWIWEQHFVILSQDS